MSHPEHILAQLTEQQILLQLVDGKLSLNYPKNALSESLLALVKTHKTELIEYLTERESRSNSGHGQELPMVAVERNNDPLQPCSFGQKRLWFIDHLEGQSSQYNMPFALHVKGQFDLRAATEAISMIVARHEILRTVYVEHQGEVFQQVNPAVDFSINQLALIELQGQQQQQKLKQLLNDDMQKSFDLATDLMIRASYIELGEHGVLLFNLHHIAADGWSIGVLINEFMKLYQVAQGDGGADSMATALAPLSIQYVDYAHWQQQLADSGALDKQLEYWLEQLAELPVLHSIRSDYPRAEYKQYKGASVSTVLPASLGEQLIHTSRQLDVTLFMLLHGALGLVLSGYGSSDDIVIGTPVANRVKAQIEGLIGCFVNTLVLRSHSRFACFDQYIADIKQRNLAAMANQDLPFEQLVEHTNVIRSGAHTPLSQIMLTLNNSESGELKLPGLTFEPVDGAEPMAKFDLDINVSCSGNDISIGWLYDTALFSEKTVTAMSQSLIYLLEQVVEAPNIPLNQLALLPLPTQQQLLDCLSDYGNEVQRQSTVERSNLPALLQCRFEHQVALTPSATALVVGENTIDYQTLNAKANQLANYLRHQGVGSGTLVGVCLERNEKLIIGLLAVLKSGGAYVPIDPSYPAKRIAAVCLGSGLTELLSEQSLTGHFETIDKLNLHLLDVLCCEQYPSENLSYINQTDDLAYVIYTSGSTGKPKGVMISHRGIDNFLAAMAYQLSQGLDKVAQAPQKWLAVTTIAFDIAGLEIFGPLCCGGQLVLTSTEQLLQPDQLITMIDALDINCLQATPAFWQMLLSAGWQGKSDLIALVGGESLPIALAQTLPAMVARLINCYGPTEATIWSLLNVFDSDFLTQAESSLAQLRTPLSNYQHVVVNHLGQMAPQGTVGELYIGGPSLALGYHHMEALSEQQFVERSFAAQPPQRWYKTGDLAILQANLQLQLVGRVDEQVKIRGFRIELAEISISLLKHQDIVDCVVLGSEDAQRLLAFVQYHEDSDLRGDEASAYQQLSQYLGNLLPAYMIPSAFIHIEQWPKTANAKIDKKALLKQANDSASGTVQGLFIAPVTELQGQLCQLWAKVLKRDGETISIKDNFFNLGGHSLLAVSLVAQIRQSLAVEVTVKDIFENPDIDALAAKIEAADTLMVRACICPTERSDDMAPLSFAQQKMWFINQLDPQSSQYNMPFALKVSGHFSVQLAEQALNQLIARHEVLRSVFVESSAQTMQYIRPHVDFKLKCIDLTALPAQQQSLQANALGLKDSQSGFDLTCDLMLRASFIRLSGTDATATGVLLFNMHHIAADGWSIGVLVDEFVALYRALQQGQPNPLPVLAIQYADYAIWQQQNREAQWLEHQLSYWQQQLQGLPELHSLPVDFVRPEVKSFAGALELGEIEPRVFKGLKALAKQQQMTLFMLFHSALALVIARHSNNDDVVIGTAVANRTQAELEPLIGCFVNTLVLRCNTKVLSVGDYFNHIRDVNLAAMDNQDVSFDHLVELSQLSRSMSHTPLFQIMFSMDTTEAGQLELDGLSFEPMDGGEPVARYDLEVTVTTEQQRAVVSWVYDKQLFKPASIARLQAHFNQLLQSLSNTELDLSQPLTKLQMLSETERYQQLHHFNQTDSAFEPNMPVNVLVQQQAQLTPDAVAVVFNDIVDGKQHSYQQLSYKELEQYSCQLANYLQQRKITAGDVVGLCVERSIDLLVGMLAIFKVGAVYLPLDPAYPEARLGYCVADANAKVVLCHQHCIGETLATAAVEFIPLDQKEVIGELSAGEHHFDSVNYLDASAPAYLIYTSGSTGQPKGVEVSHRALVAKFAAFVDVVPLSVNSRVAALASMAFDISLLELLYPLTTGASVRVVSTSVLPDMAKLADELLDCSFIHMVPGLARRWLDHVCANDMQYSGLRRFATGGDLVPGSLLQQLFQTLTDTSICQFYGPTEAVLFSVCNILEHQQDFGLGRAIGNVQLYVVDQHLQLMPTGCEGELLIGGPALAHGYLGLAAQTDEAFITNPLLLDTNTVDNPQPDKVYRSGDLVRISEQGELQFVGRADNQVKIRGFRVEPGEVEQQICAMALVKQAVVVAVDSPTGDKQLVAYVEVTEQYTEHHDDENWSLAGVIKTQLSQTLPHYMIPAFIVAVEAFVMTANGKIDRKNLPAVGPSVLNERQLAPQNEQQQQLAEIWCQILELQPEQIGINSNFFDLGGHSLLVSPLINRVAQHFNVNLSVADVFSHQTLAEFALLLATTQPNDDDDLASAQQQVDDMTDEQVALMLAQMSEQDQPDER